MTGPSDVTQRTALRELWYRWLAVVEMFARRRHGQDRLAEQEYQALREDLFRVCRSLAETAGAAGRDRNEALEGLVRPWLTLRTLERADQEILFDLRERCRQVGRDLGGPTWRSRLRGWGSPWLWLGGAAVGTAVGLATVNRLWLSLPQWLREQVLALRGAIGQTSAAQRGFVAALLIVLVTIWLAVRAMRA